VSIVLTQRWHHHQPNHSSPPLILWLTAAERTRSRHRFVTEDDTPVYLQLPRGTTLQDGDMLASETGAILVKIMAKPEPVLTITSDRKIDLLRAAYHLGNRHVSLEITATYLRIAPDSVLAEMLAQLGLQAIAEIATFHPEGGAYSHH
jgi:urease accessory protein